jgi:hypothetical protein
MLRRESFPAQNAREILGTSPTRAEKKTRGNRRFRNRRKDRPFGRRRNTLNEDKMFFGFHQNVLALLVLEF